MRPIAHLGLLVALLAVPVASAATLSDLEEIHKGTDKLIPFEVTEEEAGEPRAIVFRNAPGRVFTLVLYDAAGEEVFLKNGTRGLQTLPGLEEGNYRFFIRGTGSFQVTDKLLDRVGHPTIERILDTNATLEGAADAYAIAPSTNWTLTIDGNISLEWFDMTGATEAFEAPENVSAYRGSAYVLTIRGEPGTPYSIAFTRAEGRDPVATQAETPAPGLLLMAAAVAVSLVLRRHNA